MFHVYENMILIVNSQESREYRFRRKNRQKVALLYFRLMFDKEKHEKNKRSTLQRRVFKCRHHNCLCVVDDTRSLMIINYVSVLISIEEA